MNADMLTPSGAKVIHTFLRRCKEGVRVDLKVEPEIEEFFKSWSGGSNSSVDNYGRQWHSLNGSPIQVYDFEDRGMEQGRFSLWSPGRSLHLDGHVNVSFLRIVGASEGDGVSLIIEDLVSRTELENLAEKIKRGCAWFYMEYVKPVNYEITVEARQHV